MQVGHTRNCRSREPGHQFCLECRTGFDRDNIAGIDESIYVRLRPLDQGAGAGDVLIYGFSRDPGSTDCVALVVGAAPPAPRLAALAAQLSQKTGKPLLIFAPPGIGGPDVITCGSPEALLARLERHRPAAVIGAAPRADLPPVARLLDAARCPLILPATSPEGDS